MSSKDTSYRMIGAAKTGSGGAKAASGKGAAARQTTAPRQANVPHSPTGTALAQSAAAGGASWNSALATPPPTSPPPEQAATGEWVIEREFRSFARREGGTVDMDIRVPLPDL